MKLRSLNVKSPWHGKTWNGNELKKIMKEIPKLESNKNFPEDLKVFTKTFQYILNLDKGVSGRKLATNYEALIDQYCSSVHLLNDKFNLTFTPKFHIIESHLKFYFQQTGKSLGFYTDQLIEAMHQYVDKRLTRSNYVVKDITSDIHGENLLKGVNHINTYNLSN